MDETGWKEAGQRRWLWVGATTRIACFVIAIGRGFPGLVALLGETMQGVLCTWAVYGRWDKNRRQVCWAHLQPEVDPIV